MRRLISNVGFIWLLVTIGFMTSCIGDDELEFPEDRSDEITSTLELSILLNYFQDIPSSTDCFSVVFPIELGYNTGIVISIEDSSGLMEALQNQTTSFYVEGVVLPVLVNKNGVLSSIDSEADIESLLNFCEIPKLASILDDYESQCFEFVFPLSLVDNNDTLLFRSEDQFEEYQELKGDSFSPHLIFPITVETYDTDQIISVSSYFELFEIVNTCVKCPESTIAIDLEFDGTYTFRSSHTTGELPIGTKWYINEDLIADSKDLINLELPNGEFEICLQSFHTDCIEGTFTCRSIVVDGPCPILEFDYQRSNDNLSLYYFYADFALQKDISYGWAVYKNNEFLYFEQELPDQGDGKLTFEFGSGSYKVCLEKENVNANCQLTQYCEEFFIE